MQMKRKGELFFIHPDITLSFIYFQIFSCPNFSPLSNHKVDGIVLKCTRTLFFRGKSISQSLMLIMWGRVCYKPLSSIFLFHTFIKKHEVGKKSRKRVVGSCNFVSRKDDNVVNDILEEWEDARTKKKGRRGIRC